jgi:predicted ATPase
MIKKWSVSNFKAISKTRAVNEDENISEELVFKPLTIFCGANSSGKSSLLQSLLLIAQTMRHRNKELPLILNGTFTTLGTFDDIKSKATTTENENIKIRFTYVSPESYEFYKNDYPLYDFLDPGESAKIVGSFFSLDFCRGENTISPKLSNLELAINFEYDQTLEYYSDDPKKYLKSVLFDTDVGYDTSKKEKNDIPPNEKYELNHFMPENVRMNGMHTIARLAVNHIYNGLFFDGPFDIYPDEMLELADELEINFNWDVNMTMGLFSYLKDDLLSDIQDIESLFDLNDSNFNHKRGYPISSWTKKVHKLPEQAQNKVKNKIGYNLDKIYNKIITELTNFTISIPEDEIASPNLPEDEYLFDINKRGRNNNQRVELYNPDSVWKICFDSDFKVSEKLEELFSEISQYFISKISYLGPLREDPMLLYPFCSSSYSCEIGKKGENTAAILALNSDRISDYPITDMEDSGIFKKERKCFKSAVIEWLKYISVADGVEADVGQGGFTLKIKTPRSNHFSDLTNVGVGVSQVLPIIVMCLSAEEGSTLIIEQPELHLHPMMQTKLTDFFVAVSQSGRQCIIETHSEHIINSLRHRIAKTEAPDDEKLACDIQIYFVEKDENGSLFRSITMDKYAYISEWPDGFFDEAQISNINTLKAINKKLEQDPPDE